MQFNSLKFGETYYFKTKSDWEFKGEVRFFTDKQNFGSTGMSTSADLSAMMTNHNIKTSDVSTVGDSTDNYFKGKKIAVVKVTEIIYQPTFFLEKDKDVAIWQEIVELITLTNVDYRYLLTVKVDNKTDFASGGITSQLNTLLKGSSKFDGKYTLEHIAYDRPLTDFDDVNNQLILEKYIEQFSKLTKSFNTLIDVSSSVADSLRLDSVNKKITAMRAEIDEILEAIRRYTS